MFSNTINTSCQKNLVFLGVSVVYSSDHQTCLASAYWVLTCFRFRVYGSPSNCFAGARAVPPVARTPSDAKKTAEPTNAMSYKYFQDMKPDFRYLGVFQDITHHCCFNEMNS